MHKPVDLHTAAERYVCGMNHFQDFVSENTFDKMNNLELNKYTSLETIIQHIFKSD